MNSEDGQVYSVCILQCSCFTKYNRMQSKHKQTKCEHSRRNSHRTAFSVGITILNQRIIWKDDIEFVTEFPCLLEQPCRTKNGLSVDQKPSKSVIFLTKSHKL